MSKGALNTESNKLSRLWIVCCAGWLGRSLPDVRKIASGFEAMSSTGRTWGVAWCDII
jgi:hypothetical protein